MGSAIDFFKPKIRVKELSNMEMVRGWLEDRSIEYDIITEHHLRMGCVNVYPKKMKVYVDGLDSGYDRQGIDALESVLKKYGLF